MDCPKCVGKLREKNVEDCKVDVCFVCEGIWFDSGELEKVIEADSKDFNFIDVGREELDGKEIAGMKEELDEKESACPRCGDGTKLVRREYGGKRKVNIDACPTCGGIWLDGGEIKELRRRGIVNIKDKIGDTVPFLKYIFSINGFRDFVQQVFRGHPNRPKRE